MAKIEVYNLQGEVVGDVELSPKVFAVTPNLALVHQLAVAEAANARKSIAHTKTRGEVRGGGKKPWKQKGTGRARAGSIRSPLWKGGGVTFGPRSNRNFSLKVNRRQFRQGLFMILSDKLAAKQIWILDSLKLEKIKTKELAAILKKLQDKPGIPAKGVNLLIAAPDKHLEYSARNLPKVDVLQVKDLSVRRLLGRPGLVILQAALPVLEKTYVK
jgi:large subunit ribosomal protein L4